MEMKMRMMMSTRLLVAAVVAVPATAAAWSAPPPAPAPRPSMSAPAAPPPTSEPPTAPSGAADTASAVPIFAPGSCPPCPCAVDPNAPAYPPNAYATPAYPAPFDARAPYAAGVDPRYVPPPPPPAQPSGFEEHESGYLRLFLGASGSSFITRNGESDQTKISGAGASLDVAFGGTLNNGLILFGEFLVAGPGEPVTVSGPFPGMVTNANMFGVGVGVAYYLVPSNVYFSGSALLSQLEVTADGTSLDAPSNTRLESRSGPAFNLMLGKEWWVSADWGLGVAGQLLLGTFGGGDLGTSRWNAATAAIGFTATYN